MTSPEQTQPDRRPWRRLLLALSIWVLILSPGAAYLVRRPAGEIIPNGAQPEVYSALINHGLPGGQTFRAVRNHLAGIGVSLEVAGGGDPAEWELALATSAGDPLYTGRFVLSRKTGRGYTWFRFPSMPDSRGKDFLFWIRKVSAGPEPVLICWGSKLEYYPEGNLLVQGGALPGDISFRTLYARPGGSLLQPPPLTKVSTPPWFAAPPVPILMALLLSAGLLVLSLIVADRALPILPAWGIAPAWGAALIVLFALVQSWAVKSVELSPGGQEIPANLSVRRYSLFQEYFSPQTEKEEGGGILSLRDDLELGGPAKLIFMHPDLQDVGAPMVVFHLDLPERPVFRFTPWIDPRAIEIGTDGVDFEVSLRAPPAPEVLLYRSYCSPFTVRSRPRVEVDLSPWAGKKVGLVLRTYPGPVGNTFYDWAGWGDPVVSSR